VQDSTFLFINHFSRPLPFRNKQKGGPNKQLLHLVEFSAPWKKIKNEINQNYWAKLYNNLSGNQHWTRLALDADKEEEGDYHGKDENANPGRFVTTEQLCKVCESLIREITLSSCLLMSIRQIALYRDDVGTDWPVPTANIASLGRQLRSSKGEVQYHLLESATLQAALEEPLPDNENLDTEEVFIKDPRQRTQGTTQSGQSPAAAPQLSPPAVSNIGISQAGGQNPGDNFALQTYRIRGNDPQPPL